VIAVPIKTVGKATGPHLDDILFNPTSSLPSDPLLKAVVTAFLEKKIKGHRYRARGSPKVKDFDFAFRGFHGKPQLEPEHLWLRKCRKCGKKIPALIVRRTFHTRDIVPGRQEAEEKTERLSSLLTVEGGQIYFDGFLAYHDFLGGNHER